MNILEIRKLNISFFQYQKGLQRRRLDVVRNLDLDLKQGEIMAIFGASGSGKSLLVHAILGLLPYNGFYEGEVYYKGEVLNENLLEKVRGKEIFFIPQTINSLNPLLKTSNQARMTLKRSDYSRQEEVYRDFGLGKEVDKMYPFELSGAELVIADEPTPGMDKKATDEIITYFKDLKAAGKTSLIISHDINMALACADRIAIFYDGRIIEVSSVEAFKNQGQNLKNPYSRMLIRALPENGLTLLTNKEVESLC